MWIADRHRIVDDMIEQRCKVTRFDNRLRNVSCRDKEEPARRHYGGVDRADVCTVNYDIPRWHERIFRIECHADSTAEYIFKKKDSANGAPVRILALVKIMVDHEP